MINTRVKIINKTKNTILADKAKVAKTFFKRIIGLLDRRGIEEGEGLVIMPCSSIHTFFMRFKIDVLFLDKDYHVVAMVKSLPPARIFDSFFKGKLAIELPEGSITRTNTTIRDKIEILT